MPTAKKPIHCPHCGGELETPCHQGLTPANYMETNFVITLVQDDDEGRYHAI